MKNIDKLVQRVEYFERLATHGDRKSLLQRIAQDASFEFGPPSPNASFDPNPPAPSGTVTLPTTNIVGYRPIDKNIQNMLNVLLDNEISPLFPDGQLGPQTKAALQLFKQKYGKPASPAAIAQVFKEQGNNALALNTPSAPASEYPVNPNAGAALGPMHVLDNTPDTKSNTNMNAGTERKVPLPSI